MNNEEFRTTPTGINKVKRYRFLKVVGFVTLILALLCAIAYSLYAWNQNNNLQSNLSNEQSKAKSLSGQNAQLQKQLASNLSGTTSITQTLANGKTATYPDNEGNRRILFWSAGIENNTKNFILLSDSSLQAFLSGVDPSVITKLCGTLASPTVLQYNISVGILNTDSKVLQKPQNESCVDVLASDKNTNASLKAQAVSVLAQVSNDVNSFIKSVTIK